MNASTVYVSSCVQKTLAVYKLAYNIDIYIHQDGGECDTMKTDDHARTGWLHGTEWGVSSLVYMHVWLVVVMPRVKCLMRRRQ